MNEFGEPNMGNPSVRFDEGRSESAELTTAVGSIRLLSLCLLYLVKPLEGGGCSKLRQIAVNIGGGFREGSCGAKGRAKAVKLSPGMSK
jgi:hypothetical protein